MSTYNCLWKTTWFHVHDRERLLANAGRVFPRARMDQDGEGRLRLWQEMDTNEPFLTDEDNSITLREIEEAGGVVPEGSYSDKGPDEDLGMILGFKILEFFIPDDQIVIVTSIAHMGLDISGNAWAWKKGMDYWKEVIYLNLEEIYEEAGERFGMTAFELGQLIQ